MTSATLPADNAQRTRYTVLGGISLAHFLNDAIQSLIVAIYPLLKSNFQLSYAQIGLITLVYQLTASVLQPVIGLLTDRRPQAFALPAGMGVTLAGLLLMAYATGYDALLVAAALVGVGSAVFHPESSRVARLASGGQHGLAQSVFQVGGNAGSAAGPALAVLWVMPRGQTSLAWLSVAALLAIAVLWRVDGWYRAHLVASRQRPPARRLASPLPRRTVAMALGVLGVLMFSKFFYLASFSSYYTFYLITRFGLSVAAAQWHLFVFLLGAALGTLLGGPLGDRIGGKRVIWFSILGVAPFTLALPYAGATAILPLSLVIGMILASAFPAIVVLAQALMPGRPGAVSGLFFGLAFGLGGIAAAVLGALADAYGVTLVFQACSALPLLGIFAVWLPDLRRSEPVGAVLPADLQGR